MNFENLNVDCRFIRTMKSVNGIEIMKRELSVKSKKRNSVSLRREWVLIIFLFWHRARNIRRKIRLKMNSYYELRQHFIFT